MLLLVERGATNRTRRAPAPSGLDGGLLKRVLAPSEPNRFSLLLLERDDIVGRMGALSGMGDGRPAEQI